MTEELDALIARLEDRKKLMWMAPTKEEFNLPVQQMVDVNDLFDAVSYLKILRHQGAQ